VLAGREHSHVEFKRDTIRGKRLARAAVAFANSGGGTILLGVDDDKSVIGTTRINLQE
jgi:predicted HTH transcriptional regulator